MVHLQLVIRYPSFHCSSRSTLCTDYDKRKQITRCLSVEAPLDCPAKQAGLLESCPAVRSGIFRVRGKNLSLHVGSDAANDLACMIQVTLSRESFLGDMGRDVFIRVPGECS